MLVTINFFRLSCWIYVLCKHNVIYKSAACRLMDDVALQQLAAHPQAPLRCYFIILLSVFALVLGGFEKHALRPPIKIKK